VGREGTGREGKGSRKEKAREKGKEVGDSQKIPNFIKGKLRTWSQFSILLMLPRAVTYHEIFFRALSEIRNMS